ncbi:MAG TPA: cyclase family protein [Vicinamibacteria bacterium]|jgi:arylformamidase|nr:cyclase family protein [Vicinamibacteria bacterium]
MSKIFDVTAPLSAALPLYEGDPPFALEPVQRIADGAPFNLTRIEMSCHSGTHVDAPYHFLADGVTVDQIPLDILVGKVKVLEMGVSHKVDRSDLEGVDLRDDIRLLLKTRMSGQLRHPVLQQDHVYLARDGAEYLAQIGIKLVGIDYLSIDEFGNSEFPAHQALLQAGVVVVEGLDLSEVEPGEYDMTCLPLRLVGSDGAPARVILRTRM